MSEYYDKEYFDKFVEGKSWWRKRMAPLFHRREPVFSFLKCKFNTENSLLDIGCGSGWFLAEAENYFDCTGIDVSKEAIQYAKRTTKKSTLKVLSIYDLAKIKGSYDVVTCFDTLEHVLAHEEILKEVFRLLADDGVFVMSAPNGGSISKRLKWNKWFGFKDPSHLWYHEYQDWSAKLQAAGFVPMRRWFNGLSDPPYMGWPMWLEEVVFKYPTQLLSIAGLPLPSWCGETLYIASVKNPGLGSEHDKLQSKMISKSK